ncbi:hypothetical protein J2R76_007835 [Bradyrhizobium sp. USDA 4532]|uniref:hypothetical protein n=1 Tax=Bradyrhizobium TaxID=374 RepID=UPI001456A2D6|nr:MULTISPECIES: hypothetical protein [Bradyrhizobium]MCC8948642.1 hypothetical protein [Bradyrhizobium brasilense]MCP1831135.1 hypothetical protein [Bradyrhizobium sp. USDA 4545]MCP1924244.1 hypothetical protein [Bradyrhizobium sp. USDA 4532]NLS71790.1 hypothetical protein [Bradyrhizobium brasilense]
MFPLAEPWIASAFAKASADKSSLSLLAMTAGGYRACNTLFTISVDLLFTTFMRRAFTKARNATCETCAIA